VFALEARITPSGPRPFWIVRFRNALHKQKAARKAAGAPSMNDSFMERPPELAVFLCVLFAAVRWSRLARTSSNVRSSVVIGGKADIGWTPHLGSD